MTDNHLTLFCLVDGEATSQAFSVEIHRTKTVDHLKELIKAKKPIDFENVDANNLTLRRVSIPVVPANKHKPVVLNEFEAATEFNPTDDVADVFPDKPSKKTIHIIVERPPPVHAPVPVPLRARSSTPSYLSDGSRPGTPLSGDLRADIKKITDKFSASGTPVTNFLDAFVKGQGTLPVTTGAIRGLLRAWRRAFGKPAETRPSLLFLALPDLSQSDSASRNLVSTSILNMVKENNRLLIPMLGVSGCGKIRAVIELLHQH
ncbi:hypothetical protein BGX23_009357 [Mortierella sp. AD031]|nr:hypothetical protein BGX23_009357 [Mortierella sp. AD031]